MKIKVKKLIENAILPNIATAGDAGADLYCSSVNSIMLLSGERKLVPTGIAIEIPYGYVGLVHPRSGLANKYGVSIVNTPGTIDAGYRGELLINLINHGSSLYIISPGSRIAQLVIQKVEKPIYEFVEELSDSDRGVGGWGSTGV
jgi:dUTP pyrophosphatase